MKKNKRTYLNLLCSLVVLLTNVAINYWLSPYIVNTIGIEANGYIKMANNFVMYANLIVTALNGMAARFISVAYNRGEIEKANLFYNSVFWGNLVVVGVLIVPAIVMLVFLQNIFVIPTDILLDVKILFSLSFACFFLTTGAPNWNVGCYVTNHLDREYIPEAILTIVKAAIIIGCLTLFAPHAWYVGLASFVFTASLLAINCYNTHKLTPELRVFLGRKKALCSFSAIKTLVGSGMWNSITTVGHLLLSGLDLIICNAFLGPTAMGVLAIAKTLLELTQQLSSALTRSFAPELTIDFATGNSEHLKTNIFRSMRITAMVLTIATGGMVAFGKPFFQLWMPQQDAQLLAILSGLSFGSYFFTSGTQILYNVFSATDKVKQSAIAQLISGVVSISITALLLAFTNFGMYAIVSVSTICNLVRNMVFTIPASAHFLGFKKTTFFPMVLRTVVATSLITGLSFLIIYLIKPSRWGYFILDVFIVSLISLGINCAIILSKEDRSSLIERVKRVFSKKKRDNER